MAAEKAKGQAGWTCAKCNLLFVDKQSKLFECEYCENKCCIKCLGISENMYKTLGKRPDFPWFCERCTVKAKKCIKEDKEIEEKCNNFFRQFKEEVDTRFTSMKREIDEIKEQVSRLEKEPAGAAGGANGEPRTEEQVAKRFLNNVNDRLNRQKNVIIFGLLETEPNQEEEGKTDRDYAMELTQITTGQHINRMKVKRLGEKNKQRPTEMGQDVRPRPLMITFDAEEDKTKVMKNLRKLKGAKKPWDKISVRNDLSREEREAEKILRDEARERSNRELDPNFHFQLRGPPWDRKIQRVRKRENTREQEETPKDQEKEET